MTSTEPENISSLPEGLKDDELSRRVYLGGLAGLPWIWVVHTLHWYGKQKAASPVRLPQDANDPAQVAQDLIAQNEQLWVKRCRNAAILTSIVWLSWVLIVQVFLTDSLPASWFVRQGDTYEATGW